MKLFAVTFTYMLMTGIILCSIAKAKSPAPVDLFGTGDYVWHLAFRGTAHTGTSVYQAYKDGSDNVEEGCKQISRNLTCKSHYRSKILDNWMDIEEVAFVISKSQKIKKYAIFEGNNTDNQNWFSLEKLNTSSWSDLNNLGTVQYFSIDGHPKNSRRFFINHNYNGCDQDAGWFVAIDQTKPPCPWEDEGMIPRFIYSSSDSYENWINGNVSKADTIAVFVKFSQCTDPTEAVICRDRQKAYKCHTHCPAGWTEVNECEAFGESTDDGSRPISGKAGPAQEQSLDSPQGLPTDVTTTISTMTPAPTTTPAPPTTPALQTTPAPTTIPTDTITPTPTTPQSPQMYPYIACRECPQKCTSCKFERQNLICDGCIDGYRVGDNSQCVEIKDEAEKVNLPLIVGSIVGGVAFIVLLVVVIVLLVRCHNRKRREDVTQQGQNGGISTNQLGMGNGKQKKLQPSPSMENESAELAKLPQAPDPPVGYDRLERGEEEQLDYEPVLTSAATPGQVTDDSVYVNTAFQAGAPSAMESSGKTASSDPLEMDDIYINSADNDVTGTNNYDYPVNHPEEVQQGQACQSEQDDTYGNDPWPAAPKREDLQFYDIPKGGDAVQHGQTSQFEQDDIYGNDPQPAAPTPEDLQFYDSPKDGNAAPSRQSDIYMNTENDDIYQNM